MYIGMFAAKGVFVSSVFEVTIGSHKNSVTERDQELVKRGPTVALESSLQIAVNE